MNECKDHPLTVKCSRTQWKQKCSELTVSLCRLVVTAWAWLLSWPVEPLWGEPALENASNCRSSSMDFTISSRESILKFQRFLLRGTSGKAGSDTHEPVEDSWTYIIKNNWNSTIVLASANVWSWFPSNSNVFFLFYSCNTSAIC